MRFRAWHCLILARKFLHVTLQVMYGYYRLFGITQPMVSIFGSAQAKADDQYAELARALAHMFAEADISVITGGGPGIMEAASCGAVEKPRRKSSSIGIGVRSLGEERNPCVDEFIVLDYFFARKWLLTHYSKAYIVFPGGYGTMDELMEVLTLVQTKTMVPVPIILIGTGYWGPFIDWLKNGPVSHEYIDAISFGLFVLTDDLDEAFAIAKSVCREFENVDFVDKEVL